MPLDNVNHAAYLADLKAKRAALDALITAFEAAGASGALGQGVDPAAFAVDGGADALTSASGPVDLPKGAFLGKSVPVAITLYLEATKRKQGPTEIANAIREYGVESSSKDFVIMVNTALRRLRQQGKVMLFKDGWGLSSWAPPGMRNVVQAESKAKHKKKRVKARKAKATGKPVEASQPAPETKAAQPAKGTDAIAEFLGARPGQEFSAGELAKVLGLHVGAANMNCATLVKAGRAEKAPSGKFFVGKATFAKAS